MFDWVKPGAKIVCVNENEITNPVIPKRPLVVRVGRQAEVVECKDVLNLTTGYVRVGWFNFGAYYDKGYVEYPASEFLHFWDKATGDEAPQSERVGERSMILAPEATGAPQRIGFWASSHLLEKDRYKGEFPWPGDFINRSWDSSEKAMVVKYLEKVPEVEHYMGLSPCRLCGEENGASERSDGIFLWPDGFAHYVKDHGVVPAPEFIEHVKTIEGRPSV